MTDQKFQQIKSTLEELRNSGRSMSMNEYYALDLLNEVERLKQENDMFTGWVSFSANAGARALEENLQLKNQMEGLRNGINDVLWIIDTEDLSLEEVWNGERGIRNKLIKVVNGINEQEDEDKEFEI